MERSEVICISSDDDEKTDQNEDNGKKVSVIKQLQNNCVAPEKIEVFSSESGEIVTCRRKRKASEMDTDDGSPNCTEELHKKVIIQELSQKKDSNGITNMQEKEEKPVLKPKLVVKESKPFSPVVQDIFPMFISLCLQKDRSEDMKIITNKLKRRYEQLDPVYANSNAFLDFVNEKRNDIINSKNKFYVYIADVMNEMKNRCDGRSTLLLNSKKHTSDEQYNENSNIISSNTAHTSHINNTGMNKKKDSINEDDIMDIKKKKIKLILRTMKECEMHIKKLEEAEVDFDAEDNSTYIKLERYKQRMVQLHRKYCELTGENIDAGRQYLRPKHMSTSGIVAVDRAITNFINSKLSKLSKHKKVGSFTDAVIFPDYKDILDCIGRCNESHNLSLDTKQQQRLAKKAFTELGEYLQRSRRNDYWDTFSLFLENQEDDPALKNPELAEKLIENKRLGEERLANVFELYVKKQVESKNNPEDDKTSSDEEGEDEDSIENEDEDSSNKDDDIIEEEDRLSIDKDNSTSEEEDKEEEEEEVNEFVLVVEEEEVEEEEEEEEVVKEGNEVEKEDKEEEEEKEKEKEQTQEEEEKEKEYKQEEEEEKEKEHKQEEEKEQKQQDKAIASNKDKVTINKEDTKDEVDVDYVDIIEINENCQSDASDRLKKTVNDTNCKSTKSNDVNISNVTNNSEPLVSKGNDGTTSSNTSADVTPFTKIDASMVTAEDVVEDSNPVGEKKPLLRLRSFAKPPTTWKDGSGKIDGSDAEQKTTTTPSSKVIVDLTTESPNGTSTAPNSCADVQTGTNKLICMREKLKEALKPTHTKVIVVGELANHYRKANLQNNLNSATKSQNKEEVSPLCGLLNINTQMPTCPVLKQYSNRKTVTQKQNSK
ncbi:PREDICTED: death domain-associated protein 6-like [Dufourea novaeangliae]|uniref:death domain-associated protein 6-like n=1 Tax=Dufourea novaeangliae TaxID=178035 RepID=UPI0007679E06|nr:PREDICTED: death domain-associated protein 6-like [Dufourea novaeangliae]